MIPGRNAAFSRLSLQENLPTTEIYVQDITTYFVYMFIRKSHLQDASSSWSNGLKERHGSHSNSISRPSLTLILLLLQNII